VFQGRSKKSSPVLLEPIMRVEIATPEEYMVMLLEISIGGVA